ncbi:polygalacturonase [Alnus glutinosa]|uniref:polygalacturonase n=1 Tax=Alnus glutinosa TaxID=3517 RepID=UPI002D7689AE|nr:polygalacturonase [Alnus glutinosa]
MSLHSNFLTLFIVLASFSSCFGRYQEDPLGYPKAYTTTSKRAVQDRKFKTENFGRTTRLARASTPSTSPKLVSVDDFGAKGDGGDDTEAFGKAWMEACSSKDSVLVVPENRNYYLKPITFSGPCESNFIMKVYGTIKASPDRSDYQTDTRHWIVFENIQNFRVEGGGIINGNGREWWINSCKVDKTRPCTHAPTAVTFRSCNDLIVDNLWIQNAQQMHLTFDECVNVVASNLMVTAPGNSPNTDGIHVTETQDIQIQNCDIRTGDDCISIVSGSENVRATDITCGPGHGISIGSLGADGSSDYVSNVIVNRATLSGTTNGLRIKTWQGGSGYAKNIMFQNVVMHNVSNPIIIDQYYCDRKDSSCSEQASAVKVSNVVYKNIKGTSASEEAINFSCSQSVPCEEIVLQDVNLGLQGDGSIEATCESVELTKRGNVYPRC